jgi:hypothetical protein
MTANLVNPTTEEGPFKEYVKMYCIVHTYTRENSRKGTYNHSKIQITIRHGIFLAGCGNQVAYVNTALPRPSEMRSRYRKKKRKKKKMAI